MDKRNNQPDKNDQNDYHQIKIELDLLYPHSDYQYRPHYCTFNFRGEFILYTKLNNTDVQRNRKIHFDSSDNKIVWIYSTKTKNDKWTCKKIYKVPENFELISVSKHDEQDKFYLFSNGYFYVWNMDTEKSTRIFINKNEKEEEHQKKEQMKDWNKVIKY